MNIYLLSIASTTVISMITYKWLIINIRELRRDIDLYSRDLDVMEPRIISRVKATYEDILNDHYNKINQLKDKISKLELYIINKTESVTTNKSELEAIRKSESTTLISSNKKDSDIVTSNPVITKENPTKTPKDKNAK